MEYTPNVRETHGATALGGGFETNYSTEQFLTTTAARAAAE